MRLRWGRIGCVGMGLAAGVPTGLVGVAWLTSPTPAPTHRAAPGPRACRADDVLLEALTLRPALGEKVERVVDAAPPEWRFAAEAVLAAAACDEIGEVPRDERFSLYALMVRGTRWLIDQEAPVEDLLTVWELAEDQARSGVMVDLAVATAHHRPLRDALDVRLAGTEPSELTPDARARAAARLRALADHRVDWGELNARDERAVWAIGWPLGLAHPIDMVTLLVDDRTARFPMRDELDQDAALTRLDALLLAMALDPAGCAQPAPDRRDLHLGVDRVRCVAYGYVGDKVRLASLGRSWGGPTLAR